MKQLAIHSLLILAFVGFASPGWSQAIRIPYPNPAYLHWEEPNGFDNYSISFMSTGFYQTETTLSAIPFYCYGSSPVTVYGVAVYLVEGGRSEITQNDVVEISIYEATVGDSQLRLLKSQTFPVSRGQCPDVYLQYKNNEDPNLPYYLGMYEFYFDTPLQLRGTHYFIGFKTEFGHLGWRAYLTMFSASDRANMGCSPSYQYANVDKKNHKLVQYQLSCYDEDGNYIEVRESDPDGLPVLPPEETYCVLTQGMLPIIQPQGYLSALQPTEDADRSAVRLVPNPASTQVTVSAAEPIRSLQLFDVEGRLVFQRQYDGDAHSVSVDVRSLAPGAYAAKVITSARETTLKLMVE